MNIQKLIEKSNSTQDEINALYKQMKPVPENTLYIEDYIINFNTIIEEIEAKNTTNESTIKSKNALIESINKYEDDLNNEIKELSEFNHSIQIKTESLKKELFELIPKELYNYTHSIEMPHNSDTAKVICEIGIPFYFNSYKITAFSKGDVVQQVRLCIIEKLMVESPQPDCKNYHSSRVQVNKYNLNHITDLVKLLTAISNI